MKNNYSVDLKIAEFFKKVLNYYIKKRIKALNEKEKRIWLANFHNCDNFVHTLEKDLFIKLFKDSILSELIFVGFEQVEINFIKRFLKEGDIFFDIGANIGLFSIIGSKIVGESGQIHSFEPTPTTFSRLIENINLNNFKNIIANNIGLSNLPGNLEFNISKDGYDAWNSFAKLDSMRNCDIIKIPVTTLDSYIETKRIGKVNLIKLDVEGWEKFVLEGGLKTISLNEPPVFIIEFTEEHSFSAGYYSGDVYDLMNSFGFGWYSYDSSKNQFLMEKKKLHYPYENLIAIKDILEANRRIGNIN